MSDLVFVFFKLLHAERAGAEIDPSSRRDSLCGAESDEIFVARPLASKAGAAVSHQDGELTDENLFNAEVQRIIAAGRPVPRPAPAKAAGP